jgi:hypothetical protein
VGVVAVVLAGPPAVAESGGQVAAQDAEDIVGAPCAEDLPVPGVVAKECDLGEGHGQEHGGAELPPRVPEDGERCPSGRERQRGERDLPGVITQPAIQQARLPHTTGQHRVLAAAPGGLGTPAGAGLHNRGSVHRRGSSGWSVAVGLIAGGQGLEPHQGTAWHNPAQLPPPQRWLF